jgi:universal stress protein E
MNTSFSGYKGILAATDFSDHGTRAVQRALWIAQQSCKRLVVANVVADIRKAIHQTSYGSRVDFLHGDEEQFQRELRRESDERLKREITSLGSTGIEIKYETLLGEPYQELTHSVQQERYDLVVAGTRGHSPLKQLVLGSTAKRLIHNCPASVWIVKNKTIKPPAKIVAAIDMSDVSRRALEEGVWTAKQSGAQLHVLHVIESTNLGANLLDTQVAGTPSKSVRELIRNEVGQQFQQFVSSVGVDAANATKHISWGSPAHETVRIAAELGADLVVLGTIGRGGFQGLLLGNTAETVLTQCDCDVLAVKPTDFVSRIPPATWPLHPGPEKKQ